MPRTGSRRSPEAGGGTRQRLVDAAVAVLGAQGYAGATSRAIAEEAGCNQALVFYHHGSLNDLLLAALDASSQAALERYRTRLAGVDSVSDVLTVLQELYPADQASGHIGLLAEMVAGGIVDPDLGTEVALRVQPWLQLTRDALADALPGPVARRLPLDDLAYLIVTGALGGEMLATLTGDHERNRAVVDRVAGSGLLRLLGR